MTNSFLKAWDAANDAALNCVSLVKFVPEYYNIIESLFSWVYKEKGNTTLEI